MNNFPLMPVLFVGHGSPMNAIESNRFSDTWANLGRNLPRPDAILCISAHWETPGSRITAVEHPRTIHDFGGFPRALYEASYPAPGSPVLAARIQALLGATHAALDLEWGLDHGSWSVLARMFPRADIAVVQLSLDTTLDGQAHYDLAQKLLPLRKEGVLIIGSGNLVHNLGAIELKDGDINTPYGFDWAIEANELFKRLVTEQRHQELCNYHALGHAAKLAINSAEHFLPMLYAVALQQEGEQIAFFNDRAIAGSLTMTSCVVGAAEVLSLMQGIECT